MRALCIFDLKPYSHQREILEDLRLEREEYNSYRNLVVDATGSGKTVIMAGLILYLYTKGYSNFLFFVNQTNILEKTKENFLNGASNKYLFADKIEIAGRQVYVQEVNNFSMSDPNAINICFTTTQQLHYDLNFPKENSLTIEDFKDYKVVLISDESHHINTRTKKRTKAEEEEDKSWEYSVDKIFHANRDNILIEFTATADLKDPAVKQKYLDKIIFDYSLAKFRESGYTKDFQNFQSEFDIWNRTLAALILSEYRRFLFSNAGQNIKPVILLKSQRIKDSQDFYEVFFIKLNQLKAEDIEKLNTDDNPLLMEAIKYFKVKDRSLENLVQTLKLSFNKEKSIIMNGSTDNTKDKQLAVNSLEDQANPYRIIFTVDMLNEGWDVLNLFDIVRLYETRQSGKKISPYTIKEAQLIGRGARYCPFVAEEEQARFKRKYDYDLNNKNRLLETLLYHSKQDSRYITELRVALKATGLLPEQPIELEYKLKEKFKETDFFKNGILFSNRKVLKSREYVNQIDKKIQSLVVPVRLSYGRSSLTGLFEEDTNNIKIEGCQKSIRYKIREIPLNILYGAMDLFDLLQFNVLKSYYPQLKSKKEFLTSPNYIGNVTIQIDSYRERISAIDLLEATTKAMSQIAEHIGGIREEFQGTKEFYPKLVRNVIRDKKIYINNPQGEGIGVSQAMVIQELAVNLYDEDWYVYSDNYGTGEEKAFVKYFKGLIPDLRKTYEEIYLVRNERLEKLAIYDFDTGERFEPDFLLFLRKKNQVGFEQQQIYIEPKGEHLLEKDVWKEKFLFKIAEEGIPVKRYVNDNEYRISGLPFFNKAFKMKEFEEGISVYFQKEN